MSDKTDIDGPDLSELREDALWALGLLVGVLLFLGVLVVAIGP